MPPSCRLLATCSADQTCKIWRTSNFSLMTELSIKSNNPGETSRGWMWDCAFSGDSQYIVTGEAAPGLCQGLQQPWLDMARAWGTGGVRWEHPLLLAGAFCAATVEQLLELERRSSVVLFIPQFTGC